MLSKAFSAAESEPAAILPGHRARACCTRSCPHHAQPDMKPPAPQRCPQYHRRIAIGPPREPLSVTVLATDPNWP